MHIPACDRRKLDPKSIKCIFVGYCDTTKAYRLWDAASRRIKISRDFLFNETTQSTHPDSTISPERDETSVMIPPTVVPPRRSGREPQPKRLWAELATEESSTNSSTEEIKEPTNFQSAISGLDSAKWKAAMDEEYQSLMVNKTWSLVPLPTGRSAIGCRWTFKLKRGPDGSIQRYKARFVAKGYSQRPGVDYLETYSPVVKLDSLRCILSIASSRDLDMMQLDVKTAFLHGEVIEELYVNQPEGFIADGNESLVCKLHKGLYGLKQSSRLWNITFDSFITKFGFLSSSADPCVYYRETESEFTILAIWVQPISSSDFKYPVIDVIKSCFYLNHNISFGYLSASTWTSVMPSPFRRIHTQGSILPCLPPTPKTFR